MNSNRFYQVPRAAYLFPRTAKTGDAEGPEEAVRQWCAFELMRVYGFKITDLSFECPVKVGSRNDLRIDIVVCREGHPWIVVECKKTEHKDHGKAMAQAISYADAQTIRAEFALYTNGVEWHVRRKVANNWVTIPSLPTLAHFESQERLVDILRSLYETMPLFYKLDEPLSPVESNCFLSLMQVFFNGHNPLTEEVSDNLRHATDNLLRAITSGDTQGGYQFGKLAQAGREWESYRKKLAPDERGHEVDTGNIFRMEMSTLSYFLRDLVRASHPPFPADVLLLRVDIALLDYAVENEMRKAFQPITPAIHHTFRAFLNHLLITRLNTSLPDTMNSDMVRRMKEYCESSWEAGAKTSCDA
jgi:hypothetical protein